MPGQKTRHNLTKVMSHFANAEAKYHHQTIKKAKIRELNPGLAARDSWGLAGGVEHEMGLFTA